MPDTSKIDNNINDTIMWLTRDFVTN
jgi:hypothetical protein